MAELSMPSLKFEITADGSAAIEELEKTADAVERTVDAASKSGSGAAKGVSDLGSAAQKAGAGMQSAAKSAEDFGKRAESGAKKASLSLKDVGEKMSSIGKGMTVAVTTPIVAALTASVKGASDMTETLGKTDVVFGDMTDRVLNWSESSVSAMGLAQQTALDMAATYGDMATGMGMSQSAAANMATTLVQLGADMASFKNISIDEVNTALTSVFTGETESLKRLGIVMTQANLQQYAYSQGITTQIQKMTQAEQVQLRYNYVLAMTKNAQGDFQRTGGNLANQTRALGETIKQAGNSFGALLVPAVTKVVSALREGAQGLAEMDDGTKRIIIAVGMVVAAVGPLLLVGGKIITMIAGIKAAMAALTINPWVLAIGGAVAAVAGLGIAMNALQPEVDKTSESYQSLKASIIEGAHGEVELDTSSVPDEVDVPVTAEGEAELDTSSLPESVDVQITANGQAALDTAQGILNDLTSGAYDGALAIDGNPEKAEQALAQIQSHIAAVDEAVSIGGNDAAAREAISNLESDIAALEGMVVVTEDPAARATLDSKLAQLKVQLATLKGSVTLSCDTEGEDALDSLKQKLDELPKDQTYKNTGEFVVSGMGAEAIQEYAEALAAAASATGDYETAVESLNKLADQDTQRKTGEVNAQLAEQYRYLTAQYNDGILTEEQYTQKVGEANEAATKKIESIQKEAEVQKQLNEQLANGTRADDAQVTAEQLKHLYAGEHVSGEESGHALSRVLADNYGDDTATKQLDAGTALNGMYNEQAARLQQVTAAVQQYQAAMAEANNTEQNGAKAADSGPGSKMSAQEAIERAQIEKEALAQYQDLLLQGNGPEEAISTVVDNFGEQLSAYEGLEESLRGLLSGEDGQGLNYSETLDKGAEIDTAIGEYQGRIDQAVTDAQTKRQEALTTLQQTLGEVGAGYTEAETQAALSAIEGAGVPIDQATEALLTTAPEMISGLASAIESGDSGQIQSAIDGILSNVDLSSAESSVEQTGGNITQGLVTGMSEGTDSANSAGQALGESAVEGVDAGAGCASPSTKTAETGRNLVAGLAEGLQDTSAITSAAQAVGEAAATAISESLSNLDLSGALSQGMGGGGVDASGITSAITSAISSAAISAAGLAVAQGQSIGNALSIGAGSGVTSGAGNIRTAVSSAINSAAISAASLAVSQGRSVGSGLSTGAGAGVTSGASSIRSAITSAVSSAASSASSGASSQGRAIGSALINGARSGVMSAASSLASAARSAVANAVAAAKAAANIHSPSRTMRDEVGVMLMRGAEVGITERTPTTLQVIQDSMRGLISGATAVVNQGGIPAPALPIPAPAGIGIDYELLADANARRPVILNMSGRQLARATRDEAARQQAVRVSQINAGYGGR